MAPLQMCLGYVVRICGPSCVWPFLCHDISTVIWGSHFSAPLSGSCSDHLPFGGEDSGSLGIRKEQNTVNYNLAFLHLPWDVLEGSRHPQPAHLTMNPGLGSECPFQLGHLPSQCLETSPRRPHLRVPLGQL